MVILAAAGERRNQGEIIETAYDLAQAYGEPLHVLHVIPQEEAEEHFEGIREIDEFRDSSFVVEEERALDIAKSLTDMTLENGDGVEIEPVGRIGNPSEEILSIAESLDARYIVIGGRKRSPTGKAIFGSVTQSVTLGSDRPVVTVIVE